jgi:hypothetical protein
MSDDRIQRESHLRSFKPVRPAAQIADEIAGIKRIDPLALPSTNDTMAFQRAVRQREKLQRAAVRIPVVAKKG